MEKGVKRKLNIDSDGHPTECPQDECRARTEDGDDPIAISNIDGYECCNCGCWFEAHDGELEWIYASVPVPL